MVCGMWGIYKIKDILVNKIMLKQFIGHYKRKSPQWVEQRLVWLVKHAWENVSFYRDKMKESGITPDDIQSLKDFMEYFPKTNSSEYRSIQQNKGFSYLIDKNLQMTDLIESRSSGSSDIPISIFMTSDEKQYQDAKALWHFIRAGLRPWHRSMAVVPPGQVE